ncbi:MAG TPA: hypothetical protein VIN61_17485 [Gammaproteobacteria bacterium]
MLNAKTKRAAATAAVAAAVTSAAAAAGADGRNAFGQPDLQGYWTNNTVVPFERPPELADKPFFTEEEAAEFTRRRLGPQETEPGTAEDVHYQLTDFGLDHSQNGVVPNLRTSLVVDPPNGRLPPLKPEAAEAARRRVEYQREHGFDSAQDRSLAERCIIWSHQIPIIPVGYNSNLQIYQARDYAVIQTEMMPDARIVPLDGRPPLPDAIRQWLGDSRGRYEGDALVIETTNFTGKSNIRGMPPGALLSRDARVTERFERVDDDRLLYRATVEDPFNWAVPWTIEYPLARIEGPMFEYACHEGNYGLANTLSGARAEERAAAEAARKGGGEND